jgi:hypothetical protein
VGMKLGLWLEGNHLSWWCLRVGPEEDVWV